MARLSGAWFWGVVALVALLLSFGGNSPVFAALYNALPGLRYFRGQERAAYLVANSLVILAAMGAAWLAQWNSMREHVAGLRLRLSLNRAFYLALALGALAFVVWVGSPGTYAALIRAVTLAIIVTGAAYLIISLAMARSRPQILWAVVPLMVFELFSINMDSSAVYDHVPPGDQLSMSAPPLVAQAIADSETPFRIDGFRGLTDNYGSLYDVMDIHGISPLWMDGPYNIIEGDVPDARSWELFAVRYVFSDWQELPIPSEIVGTGADRYGAVNLHRLDDPRPFALLAYSYTVVSDDEAAYALLRDPAFDARRAVILARDPGIATTPDAPDAAEVLTFAPEAIAIHTDAPRPAILSVALPDYPGWYATIDGEETGILRAYGGLTALVVPEGDHSVRLVYNPLSYRVGALLSLVAWIGIGVIGVVLAVRRIQSTDSTQRRKG
ncbi:MAG: YfhO family protein [Anaerolineae bacterium]